MELKDYTDEDLKKELKRRKKSNEKKWQYFIGKVTKVGKTDGVRYDKVEFDIECEELKELYKICRNKTFSVVSGFGFCISNLPKEGDTVKLRYLKSKRSIKNGIFNSRIIEIIKNNENSQI